MEEDGGNREEPPERAAEEEAKPQEEEMEEPEEPISMLFLGHREAAVREETTYEVDGGEPDGVTS